MIRVTMMLLVLTVGGCQEAPQDQTQSTITMKLPPARPYAPKPAFSFGSAPRNS